MNHTNVSDTLQSDNSCLWLVGCLGFMAYQPL